MGSFSACSTTCSTTGGGTGTGLVNLFKLCLVRAAIGLASGCGCLMGDRGDTLVPWFFTLGGDALGVGSGKAIGKEIRGISSLGISLSADKFSATLINFWRCTLGSDAGGSLLGGCARLMSFSPLQPCSTSRNSNIARNCASQATLGAFFKAPVRVKTP